MRLLFIVMAIVYSTGTHAKNQTTIASDLFQPALFGGWNLNAYHYFNNGLTLGWSHGENLKFDPDKPWANQEQQDQNASVFIDWSTGPEIGYRISENGDIRIDFKIHKYQVDYLDQKERVEFTTRTVGPTYYYHWYPWDGHFVVELSLRYWFYVDAKQEGEDPLQVDPDQKALSEGAWGPGANVAFGWTL